MIRMKQVPSPLIYLPIAIVYEERNTETYQGAAILPDPSPGRCIT